MRTTAVLAAIGLFTSPAAPLRAADDDAGLLVVEQAIRAHGGTNAMARWRLINQKVKGTMYQGEKPYPFTLDLTLELPERRRAAHDIEGGRVRRLVLLFDGKQGSQVVDGVPIELAPPQVAQLRTDNYAAWVSTLVPLKDGREFLLKTMPDAEVNGRPAARVLVRHKGFPNVTLSFDKQSELLTKVEWQTQEVGVSGTKEWHFGAFKEFRGVIVPTRHVEYFNGRKAAETTVLEHTFLDKVAPTTFTKP